LSLLEVLISIGLMVLLMSMMYWFYSSSLAQRDKSTAMARDAQLARVVLDRMAREVRQAVAAMPGYGPGVFGYKDRIEVNTLSIPERELSEKREITDVELPGQFDLEQVRYYIAWDDVNVDSNGDPRALGLVRRVSRTYLRDVVVMEGDEEVADAGEDAALAFKEELYAPEIKFLEFHYYDGAKWWDKWELTQVNSLPQIVRITVGFVPVIPEDEDDQLVEDDFLVRPEDMPPLPKDRYTVFVRLRQADVFFGSRLTREASAFTESTLQ
jgi:type II secretory pathway pseudopilin PulG